jgi:outer membrane protein OmpA-like peptidoglycan-associated protein
MNYLVAKGIDRSRIVARGYGMERPVASNETAEGRASNRRVEVVPIR